MDDQAIARYEDALAKGVAALRLKDRGETRYHFQRALSYLEDIGDTERRRQLLGASALSFVKTGFADLGRIGAERAIALDQKGKDVRHLAEDVITLGWVELQVGDFDRARELFRSARDIALKNGDHENAASASTNLAIVIGKEEPVTPERLQNAIGLLHDSLQHLKTSTRKHPATEMTTRVYLIQALEAARESPEEIFRVARDLFDGFAEKLRDDQWKNTLGPLRETFDRYLATPSARKAGAWTRQDFPELSRERSTDA